MPTPAQGQRQNTATSTPQPRAVDQEMHLPPGSVWGSGSRASVATTSSSASSVVNGPATSSGKGGTKSGKDKASGSTSREMKKGVDKDQKADKGGAENVENNGSCGTIVSTSSKTAKVPSSTKGNKDKQEGFFLDKNSPSTLTPPAPPPPVPSST
eukprot:CAMPEP_0179004630 /NCGR_PEP_ID=MMETSP0795-20121207/13420_1 /TAXON_ID=88552 /ORGANISM="Amoebophrya sp., Strain Ameob2" /LENGTH=154 /DNA_ID=CAMNT_0020698931 /DNA_START=105 /DNA_END=565 /DNA_ORIENTATION=+